MGEGRGLLAALSLGACGVQLGTRLIATQEANVHAAYQEALLEATDEDTLIIGRPFGYVTRLLNTTYSQNLKRAEEEGLTIEEFMSLTDEASHHRGAIQGLLDQGHINAGQISGAIGQIPSVAQLFQEMVAEARKRSSQIQDWLN
jgi:enoyl-[acyl-carrier protein] reductase II